jgi:hypothetical protein
MFINAMAGPRSELEKPGWDDAAVSITPVGHYRPAKTGGLGPLKGRPVLCPVTADMYASFFWAKSRTFDPDAGTGPANAN